MTPCPTCPVPSGFVCVAITTGHGRYCQLCDPAHPDFNPTIKADVIADSTGQPRAFTASPRPNPPALPAPLIVRMELCRYRVSPCACLSRPAVCLGYGDPTTVTHLDCSDCPDDPQP